MFGSQALDTALGLVLMLFVLATAASSILELVNRLARTRAKNLERTLGELLGGTGNGGADATAALAALKRTSVYAAATDSSGGRAPAYLSAKSFADAVLELASDAGSLPDVVLPGQLRERLLALLQESSNDALELRAGLERWFDEAMGRLSDAYKRQATLWLGVLGFVLAVVINAATPDVVARLWTAPVTREAVVSAAQNVGQDGNASLLRDVAGITNTLTEVSIPLGWAGVAPGGFGWWVGHLLGWGLTAVLVTVGAPFWFELLERLITFKSGGTGGQPARADQDPAAATPRVLARDQNPAYIASVLRAVTPSGASGTPGEVEVSVPESELLQNIKRAVAAGAPTAAGSS
ncbi:MAG: hypothetical protein ABJA74_12490 [Lapillicoccus sp.]